jgi:hypothetical protein
MNVTEVMQWSLAIFLALLEASLIVLIWIGAGRPAGGKFAGINLEYLVAEDDGSASFSRFQFLIFTFIVASAYIVKAFAAVNSQQDLPGIPADVLGLIGISGGTYLVSKGIQFGSGSGGSSATGSESDGRWVR